MNKNLQAMNIPEEIVNIIMDYVSQINDSKWKVIMENNKIKFKINKFYSQFAQLKYTIQSKTIYYPEPCQITHQPNLITYAGTIMCINRRLLPIPIFGPISWQSIYYIDFTINGEQFYIWMCCRENTDKHSYMLMNDVFSYTLDMVYSVSIILKIGNNIIFYL